MKAPLTSFDSRGKMDEDDESVRIGVLYNLASTYAAMGDEAGEFLEEKSERERTP